MGLLRRLLGLQDPEEDVKDDEPALDEPARDVPEPTDPASRIDAARDRLRSEIEPIEDDEE